MKENKGKLIVALDVPTIQEAKHLVEELRNDVDIFKVGSQMFTLGGPEMVRFIHSRGKRVFLDLKFHDIPNTVGSAVAAAVMLGEEENPLLMCTMHTCGGEEMLRAAVAKAVEQSDRHRVKRPLLVGITVLTSEIKTDNIPALVLERARLAKKSGLDGVVASSQEADSLRKEFGPDFVIVTPGIRPSGAVAGDQKRITTPREAIANGSHYLVVGRPIVQSSTPLEAARAILKEIEQAHQDS